MVCKLKYNTMKWMCRAQDTVGRCRQSRLPAFNAGAMNGERRYRLADGATAKNMRAE